MKILWLAAFSSSLALAGVSKVEISNFNFKYSDPYGDGSADNFSYEETSSKAQQKVHVEKIASDFKITLEGEENRELSLKDAPGLLLDAEDMELQNFNLSLNQFVSMSMDSASFVSRDKALRLKKLSVSCNQASADSMTTKLITGCFQKMSLKAGEFSSAAAKSEDMMAIYDSLMAAVDEKFDESRGTGMKGMDLSVTDGKFKFTAEVNAQISGKAQGTGTVSYDAAAKKITVKVTAINFGILNVTSTVFEKLKEKESEKLKVQQPYIYYTIK